MSPAATGVTSSSPAKAATHDQFLRARARIGDAEREWAYDKDSSIGHLAKGLTEANAMGWTVVDMKRDWKVIYPSEKRRIWRGCD